jgi:catabolite regulation protein CreA
MSAAKREGETTLKERKTIAYKMRHIISIPDEKFGAFYYRAETMKNGV